MCLICRKILQNAGSQLGNPWIVSHCVTTSCVFRHRWRAGCYSPARRPIAPAPTGHRIRLYRNTLEIPMMNRTRRGFTLIELLIVVVIIGILAAIAIPKFANTKTKAYTAAMKSDLRNLVTAEESFFADSSKYSSFTTTVTGAGGVLFKNSTGVNSPTIVPGT